ncbi:MAG: hypothetical protein WGN25_10890 [Candidatus Electrothrix sp. GW3-4]|uniref:hypothetical protein n=1 Tax=Candidatus Electrothrix sp. GW3-4 TaxID=3126740 RepID=UPI0030D59F56
MTNNALQNNLLLYVILLISLTTNSVDIFAQTSNPAIISNIGELPESVGYVTYNGSTSINAEVGRWDTPYTGGGYPMFDVEPEGKSLLYIEIDVNDGGIATFRYSLSTYDVGAYDWLDIYVIDPGSQSINIITNHSRPGQWDGTLWESPEQSQSINLSRWRDQRIRIIFSVNQDGYGDQTRSNISSFTLSTCQVSPLTPLTDPVALDFEAGNFINTDPQYFNLTTELSCLRNAVTAQGGSHNLRSAYRPAPYQRHLREVWDGWQQIRNRDEPECADLKSEYRDEFNQHGIIYRPAATSNHSNGNAFDLAIDGLSASEIDAAANSCGLYRFDPVGDRTHFSPAP